MFNPKWKEIINILVMWSITTMKMSNHIPVSFMESKFRCENERKQLTWQREGRSSNWTRFKKFESELYDKKTMNFIIYLHDSRFPSSSHTLSPIYRRRYVWECLSSPDVVLCATEGLMGQKGMYSWLWTYSGASVLLHSPRLGSV